MTRKLNIDSNVSQTTCTETVTPSVSVSSHLTPTVSGVSDTTTANPSVYKNTAPSGTTPPVLSQGRHVNYKQADSPATPQQQSSAFQRQTRHRQTFHGTAGKASPVMLYVCYVNNIRCSPIIFSESINTISNSGLSIHVSGEFTSPEVDF